MKSTRTVYVVTAIVGALTCCSCTKDPEHEHSPAEAKGDVSAVIESPNESVLSHQQTVRAEIGNVAVDVALDGYVVPDERRTKKVSVRVSGRLERLFVKYPWQYVVKGDRVLDIYSPDLNTMIEEYVYLLSKNEQSLAQRAKERLMYLGMDEAAIRALPADRTAGSTVSVYSPISGYVFPATESFTGTTDLSSGPMGASLMQMDNGVRSESTTELKTAEWLREGMYVNRERTLFGVNDMDRVWIMVMGNTQLLKHLKVGQSISVRSEQYPNSVMNVAVNFIEQIFDAEQKLMRMRVEVNNANHRLLANSLFKASTTLTLSNVISVPTSAVLDLGAHKIVWVKTAKSDHSKSTFVIRNVDAAYFGDRAVVFAGLNPGEEIARNAGMLLDSESLVPR